MSGSWELRHHPHLDGYQIEWLGPEVAYFSQRNHLFRALSLAPGIEKEHVGSFPAPFWKKMVSIARLGQRFLRFMFFVVLPMPDGSVFTSFDRSQGVFQNGSFIPLDGIKRPTRILRSGCAADKDGALYFGEYLLDSQKPSILIYRLCPGETRVSVVYEYATRSIFHVHGIFFDPFTESLWSLSGDLPHECMIIRTTDHFQTVDVVGGGDESWRAVSLQFTEKGVYYGTDAEYEQNFIYRLDRATGDREQVVEVDGPVYYSTKVGDDIFFATTAEGCPSQKKKSAVIWHICRFGNPRKIVEFEKDFFVWPHPINIFQFGVIQFAGVGGEKQIYLNPIGLSGADGKTYSLIFHKGDPDVI